MRIGLLEDDPAQATLIGDWLTQAGHDHMHCSTGRQFLSALRGETFDLAIIDWELPDTTGVDVLKQLRSDARLQLPVLFVTNRDSEMDIVTALDAGADDYIVKPARRQELLSRMGALLRRNQAAQFSAQTAFPPYVFDPAAHKVVFGGEFAELTGKEFELALFLFRNPGRLMSRAYILETVWHQRGDLNTRTVDTHVSIVRQKLRIGPDQGWRLTSVYGRGYRLEPAGA